MARPPLLFGGGIRHPEFTSFEFLCKSANSLISLIRGSSIEYDGAFMHPELQEAINLHDAIIAEASKALVGYDTEKALANVVLLSEIPTTYDKKQNRQVNAGNLLIR